MILIIGCIICLVILFIKYENVNKHDENYFIKIICIFTILFNTVFYLPMAEILILMINNGCISLKD